MEEKNPTPKPGKRKFWKKLPSISSGPNAVGVGSVLGDGTFLGLKQIVNKLGNNGIKRTDEYGNQVPIVTKDGTRYEPGFTPDSVYFVEPGSDNIAPNGWYGTLIDAHFDSPNFANLKTADPMERYQDRRDTLQQFGDWRTDYFLHDQQINGVSPILMTDGGQRHAPTTMFTSLKEYSSQWENQDPVMYAFDITIDALSSPLLNGSISDFLSLYPNVSELQSRRIVYHDFKKQFEKIFKTKGSIHYENGYNPYPLMSDAGSNMLGKIAALPATGQRLTRGKKAYLAHYLYKIEGLDKLIEANTGAENNFIVDYGKDLIKLTFSEDVSGTLSSLAHMYKLLYWSRPNGKGLVPENLLRFNCEIVVYEMRNFNRIRPVMSGNNATNQLESLRDNVSRYIYSLRECQFYFDKMAHDASIDMGGTPKTFDAYDVSFDFKYSSLKYEKWISDPNKFGKYVGYNNGAIWKVGNKGARLSQNFTVGREDNTTDTTTAGSTGTIRDASVPVFYTTDTNTLGEPGVKEIERIKNYFNPEEPAEAPAETKTFTDAKDVDQTISTPTTVNASSEDGQGKTQDKGKEKPTGFQKFKAATKKRAKTLAKKTANAVIDEVNNQINIRVQLLNSTINNIRNAFGMSGLATEPRNVYPKPYVPYSFGIFFDVRNELYNFVGENTATALAGFSGVVDPYQDPMNPTLNPFGSLVQKFGSAPTVLKNNTAAGPLTLNAIAKKFGTKPIITGKLGGK